MHVEAFIVVVNSEVFEVGEIFLGRGAVKRDVPVVKLYKKEEDAQAEKSSILWNGDGDEQVDIYKLIFDIPDKPSKIVAQVQ